MEKKRIGINTEICTLNNDRTVCNKWEGKLLCLQVVSHKEHGAFFMTNGIGSPGYCILGVFKQQTAIMKIGTVQCLADGFFGNRPAITGQSVKQPHRCQNNTIGMI